MLAFMVIVASQLGATVVQACRSGYTAMCSRALPARATNLFCQNSAELPLHRACLVLQGHYCLALGVLGDGPDAWLSEALQLSRLAALGQT